MAHTIQMPAVEGACSSLPFQPWLVTTSPDGVGQAQQLSAARATLSEPHICFSRWLVEEGDAVGPGQSVVEVLVDGVAQEVPAFGYGIVSGLVEMDGHKVIRPGDILVNVANRPDRSSRQKGLQPKGSTYQRWLRFGR
ncbi:MAG: lipoyl domain-containing protein [Alphaproteobacteria bacterium]|nr:lipoyl domain-containing protein [Alphaproteobacteria bacterium]